MFHSSKFDLEGISKLIFKNASGEILFTQDISDQKIMNTSSSLQDNTNKTEQKSVKSIFENTTYLTLKNGRNEKLATYILVLKNRLQGHQMLRLTLN